MRKRACVLMAGVLLFAGRAPLRAAKTEFQDVKVRPGDTLWSISRKWLKDPRRWNVILRHNKDKLKSSDPTAALPGMTLRVPKSIIKEDLRAAALVHAVRKVFAREKGRPAWKSAGKGKVLFNGDGLRTLAKSWARVRFFGGHVLSLDPNSMAILKSPRKADHDLYLKRGTVTSTQARIKTPSALIVPRKKNTKLSATVAEDLSTQVRVFAGAADVEDIKGRKKITVRAGFRTKVALDAAPATPTKMPKIDPRLQPQVASLGRGNIVSPVRVRSGAVSSPEAGNAVLATDIKQLSIGMPVAAYHVQISRDRRFGHVLYDKKFDAYDGVNLRDAGLGEGRYWIRVAIIDLLGDRGVFSKPRRYGIGGGRAVESLAFRGELDVTLPNRPEVTVRRKFYRIAGRADTELQVMINSVRVRKDEDGNFSHRVSLTKGENVFRIEATDMRGNSREIVRKVFYRP